MGSDASLRGRYFWIRRAGWFALIWFVSVVAMVAFAMVFRLMMAAAGLTP